MSANNCTLEFENGTTVHLQEDMDRVVEFVNGARDEGDRRLIQFRRMASFLNRAAHSFPYVWVDPHKVVGIYPLSTFSDHPDRDTLAAMLPEQQPPSPEAQAAEAARRVAQMS